MKKLSLLLLVASAVSAYALPALAEDLEFMLSNKSEANLVEFYASPQDVNNWEEDILGRDILETGDSVRVTIADGRTQCHYDLRMVFEDGEVLEDTVDLCDTGSYTIEQAAG